MNIVDGPKLNNIIFLRVYVCMYVLGCAEVVEVGLVVVLVRSRRPKHS